MLLIFGSLTLVSAPLHPASATPRLSTIMNDLWSAHNERELVSFNKDAVSIKKYTMVLILGQKFVVSRDTSTREHHVTTQGDATVAVIY